MLRTQIPIHTFAEWDSATLASATPILWVMTVARPGPSTARPSIWSMWTTGWTEMRALPTKAQRWVLEALADIAAALPFPFLELDCDNGGEVINVAL